MGWSHSSWRLSGSLTWQEKGKEQVPPAVPQHPTAAWLRVTGAVGEPKQSPTPTHSQPTPSGPPQGQVRHAGSSPNLADLLRPGRGKAVLPTIDWSFLSGSPSRHGGVSSPPPPQGGLSFTLSQLRPPLRSLAFGSHSTPVGVCSPPRRQPKEAAAHGGPSEEAREGGSRGRRGAAAPARPPRSLCGGAGKSRHSPTVNRV